MKKTTLIALAATATLGTQVLAGSLADPVIAAPLIVEDTTSTSSGAAVLSVLAILTIAASISD